MNFPRNILARGLVVLTGFLFLLLIAKQAPAEEYGKLSLMIANGSILQLLLGFGSDASLLWHSIRQGHSFARKGFSLSVVLLTIQISLFVLLSYGYFNLAHVTLLSQVKESNFIGWEIVYFSALLLTEKLLTLFYGTGKILLANGLLLICNLTLCAVLFFAGLSWIQQAGYSYIGIYCLFVLSQASILLPIYLLKERPSFRFLSKKDWRSLFNFSFAVFITNLIQFLAYRADYWVLFYFHGPEDLAVYSQSVRFVQFAWIIPNVLASLLAARLPGMEDEQKERWMDNLLRKSILYGIVMIPFLIAISWLLYHFYLPETYSRGWLLVLLMLPGYLLFIFAILLSAIFSANRLLFINLKGSILCFLIIVPLDLLLIPSWADWGAATGTLVAYGITGLYFLFQYRRWKSQPMPSFTKFTLKDISGFIRTLGES